MRRTVGRIGSLPVRLAAENLPRDPHRGGMTVASITAAIAMAASAAGLVQSFERAWVQWIEQRFGSDVVVGSGSRLRLLAGPAMAAEVADRLAALPEVADVEPFRVLPIRLGARPAFLQSVSPEVRAARGGLMMVEGDSTAALASLTVGDTVLLSDNLAVRLKLHAGDHPEIPTPTGPRAFRIAGTFVDYLGSLDLGSVVVARQATARTWNDRYANLIRLWARDGVTPSELRAVVLRRLGPGYYAVTTRQFVDAVRAALRRFFVASWALTVLAVVVGVIGIVNAQVATVLDRTTEIATIRTIGVSRADITRAVILEMRSDRDVGRDRRRGAGRHARGAIHGSFAAARHRVAYPVSVSDGDGGGRDRCGGADLGNGRVRPGPCGRPTHAAADQRGLRDGSGPSGTPSGCLRLRDHGHRRRGFAPSRHDLQPRQTMLDPAKLGFLAESSGIPRESRESIRLLSGALPFACLLQVRESASRSASSRPRNTSLTTIEELLDLDVEHLDDTKCRQQRWNPTAGGDQRDGVDTEGRLPPPAGTRSSPATRNRAET